MPSTPSRRTGGEWASYSAGMIVRCPGENTATNRPCQAGMGQVSAGRKVRVRVRGTLDDRDTDLVVMCRRCRSEVEQQITRGT